MTMRCLPCLPLLFVAACSGRSTSSAAPSTDASPACDPSGCLSTPIEIRDYYASWTLTPCNAYDGYAFNGMRGVSCSAAIPACGDVSVDAINRALTDPDVVAALQANAEFVDPTLPAAVADSIVIGPPPPSDGGAPSNDAGTHGFFLGSMCRSGAQCTPAPPGILRLFHVLEGLGPLCKAM